MKRLSLLLYLLLPIIAYAQNYTIEYDVSLNSIDKIGILQIEKGIAKYYYETQLNKVEDSKKINDEGRAEINIIVESSKDKVRYQFYDVSVDSLVNIDFIKEEKIIYKESLPTMNWKLEKETKLISKYKCRKATTTFRGRNYIAWVSPEIPLTTGPWKFVNTPGAILEVYDESLAFYWGVKRISSIDNKLTEIDINSFKTMSIEQFVKESELAKTERSNQVILKIMERGGEIIKREFNRGRELIFKWEED